MWFTVGFAIAAIVGAYLYSGIWLLAVAFFGVLVISCLLLFRRKINPIVFGLLIGFAVGLCYHWGYDRIVLSSAKVYDGTTVPVEVTATDFSFETEYGMGVDGRIKLNGRSYRTRLYYQGEMPAQPGDNIRIHAKLRYTPSGGLQISTYHKGEGIFLLAYGENEPVIDKAADSHVRYFASYMRKGIRDRIVQIFPDDTAAFAKALLIGDDSDITYEDNIAFQKSGIRHVIAVSGLHVSILFCIVYFLTGRKRMLVLMLGLPVLFLFAAVAGFSPSVVRACIMQALLIISLAIDRQYDPGTALSFACLVILMVNPLAITSVSFQLSVGCMIGILLISGPIQNYLKGKIKLSRGKGWKAKLVRWCIGSVSVSIGAMITTMPLCAMYFGMVTVIGILTNLLVLWLILFIFCGIIAACLLSCVFLPLGSIIAGILSWPIRYVFLVSKAIAAIGVGSVYTDSPYSVLWIVFTFLLLALFLLTKKRSAIWLAVSVVVLYALSLAASWAEPRMDSVRVTVLDVGQGQCVLLQSKNHVYMIDCGGDDPQMTATTAINAMGAQGIFRLDGLILTHYDDDHCNGAVYLMEAIPVEQVYLPDTDPDNETRKQLENMAISINWVCDNRMIDLPTGNLQIFPSNFGSIGNKSSMCILFQGGNCDILITGDRNISGEHMLLVQADIPELELLVAGHHGASTSTGLELLQRCDPAVVVISAGKDNFYGHPHSETLKRLSDAGCIVRRTDLEGTIIFRG